MLKKSQAGHQCECSPEDGEAYQCRAQADTICLWCYSSLNAPWGPEYVTFLLYFLPFFPVSPHYVVQVCQVSPSQAERKLLTSVGHFIVVCNIVYVPIAALYHVYRLLKR